MNEVERVYRAYNDAENAHDLEATTSLVTEDLAVAINGIPQLSSGSDDEQAMATLFATYPDYRREVLEVIVEGDRGAIRWRMVGTPAAGRDIPPLDLHGCSIVEVRNGRLARANIYADMSVLAAVLPGGE